LISGAFITGKKNYAHAKKLYINVPSSFIKNSPKLKKTQMSFNRSIIKLEMVHLFHGILPSNKKVLNYRYMQQIG
jgi:hypothetical protein